MSLVYIVHILDLTVTGEMSAGISIEVHGNSEGADAGSGRYSEDFRRSIDEAFTLNGEVAVFLYVKNPVGLGRCACSELPAGQYPRLYFCIFGPFKESMMGISKTGDKEEGGLKRSKKGTA